MKKGEKHFYKNHFFLQEKEKYKNVGDRVRERASLWSSCLSSVSVSEKETDGRRITTGREKESDWETNFKQNQLKGSRRLEKKNKHMAPKGESLMKSEE